ncbi:MAG: HAD-IB family phosphatase [Candidatus Micrarchaeota archaeon]
MGKVSIVIPALNEGRTIGPTVRECLKSRAVLEVVVVDDKSSDRTAELAREAGARVLVSQVRGKGKSMEDGLAAARGEIVVFVDADIRNFSSGMIDAITSPILEDRCDFVKSAYGRRSGRVTEILVKPLLSELFPPLVDFRQPLSGIIAGKAGFFRKVGFENDYGVDVGILIDMVNAGARIMEVDIGYIEHKMKPWRKLRGMAGEVTRSILKRAKMTNRMLQDGLIAEASLLGGIVTKSAEVAFPIDRIAFIDIDGTLIRQRFIFAFAKKRSFHDALASLSSSVIEGYSRTKAIAGLMKGAMRDEISAFSKRMRLSSNVDSFMGRLRKNGYYTVLVTDGYEAVAKAVADRVGADAIIANRLRYDKGVCTGDIEINPLFLPLGPSCANHAVCKLTAAMRFCRMHEVAFEKTFAIGNSENDACLLRFANISYAYRPAGAEVAASAKYVIKDMAEAKIF